MPPARRSSALELRKSGGLVAASKTGRRRSALDAPAIAATPDAAPPEETLWKAKKPDILLEAGLEVSEPVQLPRSLHQQARHAPPPSHAFPPIKSRGETESVAAPESPDLKSKIGDSHSGPEQKTNLIRGPIGLPILEVDAGSEAMSHADRRRLSLIRHGQTVNPNAPSSVREAGEDPDMQRQASDMTDISSVSEMTRTISDGLVPDEEDVAASKIIAPPRCALLPGQNITLLPGQFIHGVDMGALPDVFRDVDSHLSPSLPLPRRHARSDGLEGSDARHEEGIRMMRDRDYERACKVLESAWEMMEEELAQESREIEGLAKTPPDEEGDHDNSYETMRKRQEKQRQRVILRIQRHKEHEATERRYKREMGLDLSLVYTRLQQWQKVDEVTSRILDTFGPLDKLPEFRHREDEERWAQLMIRRGVACAFLGMQHFDRAEGCFSHVLKALPRHRDAKRGLHCVRFLTSQMLPKESYSAMLDALSGI